MRAVRPAAQPDQRPGASGTWRRAEAWRVPPLALELGVLALALLAAAHLIYLTRYGASVRNGDVAEYRQYAEAFWLHQPRFRALPIEYPPLAILPFTLTLLPPLPDPLGVFECWMGALVMAGYVWFRRYASRERAVIYAAYLILGAAATVLARFDLFPALATLLALWATQRRRFTLAYVLLAVGVLLKLYPAFLVPMVAIEQWRVLGAGAGDRGGARRRPRAAARWPDLRQIARRPDLRQVASGLGLCLGIVAVGFGIAALLSPVGALSGFSYADTRPLQIESTPASLLWLGTLVGLPAHTIYTYHSLNYVGPLDGVLERLSMVALIVGCLVVYWRQWQRRLDVGRAFVACLCVVIVANKIFSPQYLIWILPLVAYVVGFDLLWLAIGLLTTLIYPFIYFAHPHILLVAPDWRFLPTIAVRNALLVVATVRTILGDPRHPASLRGLPPPGLRRRPDRAAGPVPASLPGS